MLGTFRSLLVIPFSASAEIAVPELLVKPVVVSEDTLPGNESVAVP